MQCFIYGKPPTFTRKQQDILSRSALPSILEFYNNPQNVQAYEKWLATWKQQTLQATETTLKTNEV